MTDTPESAERYVPNLILIGPRASGKTTLARLLAKRLDLPPSDVDYLIQRRAEVPIADLVANAGWDAFRRLESVVLRQLLEHGGRIVSTGGGAVLLPENREMMHQSGFVVYLKGSPEVLAARLRAAPDADSRPPLRPGLSLEDEVAEVLAEREPLYAGCADLVLDAAQSPESLAESIALAYIEAVSPEPDTEAQA